MTGNQINAYLARARQIIGERSQAEIDYDNAVVAHLNSGADIKNAIAAANRMYPNESLAPGPGDWPDVEARYQYIREHKRILNGLGISE